MENHKNKINKFKSGSAMIMAVAIVTMLAVVGAVFLLVSRMDEAATSSVADFKAMDNAVDSVISKLASELELDAPGGDPNTEYYDYPGDNDKWLANLEPYDDGGVYKWMQITDLFSDFNDTDRQDIRPEIVADNDAIDVDAYGMPDNDLTDIADADADGDGVSDSKWVRLLNVSSSSGQPLYAAIRVIDNGGMINVNTAYEFDPNSSRRNRIDGRWISQIDLDGLRRIDEVNDIEDLHEFRVDTNNIDLHNFSYYMQYSSFTANNRSFTPFDISDELELRNRFLLADEFLETRLEDAWPWTVPNLTTRNAFYVPIGQSSTINDWYNRMWLNDAASHDQKDRRHLMTTYNADRLIDPNGEIQLNVSAETPIIDANELYNRLYNGRIFDVNDSKARDYFARISANIIDYQDNDSNISKVYPDEPYNSSKVNVMYGWERPYIYISELVAKFEWEDDANKVDPNTLHTSFAIEIYKDFDRIDYDDFEDSDWWLEVPGKTGKNNGIPLKYQDFYETGGRFVVLTFNDANYANFDSNDIEFTDSPPDGANNISLDVVLAWDDAEDDLDPDPNYIYNLYLMENNCSSCDCEDELNNAINDANHSEYPLTPIYTGPNLSYDPVLDPNTKYCWRVDVNDLSDPNIYYEGPVMEFTTNDGNDPNISDYGRLDLDPDDRIELYREIDGNPVLVDDIGFEESHSEFDNIDADSWFLIDANTGVTKSYKRDLGHTRRLKKLWNFNGEDQYDDNLGRWNRYNSLKKRDSSGNVTGIRDIEPIQILDYGFNNSGDIFQILTVNPYAPSSSDRLGNTDSRIYMDDKEYDVRVDLADPNVQKIFNYITALNPSGNRLKGRININTAPWFVIAQLPWVSEKGSLGITDKYALAKAIVDYRERTNNYLPGSMSTNIGNAEVTPSKQFRGGLSYNGTAYKVIRDADWRDYINNTLANRKGFATTGELNYVIAGNDEESMNFYALDGKNQRGFPDIHFFWFSRRDGMTDDFEERNLIFSRISDLVTVRSDVFTAYIVVRLGVDGPQRRVIAILDRSTGKARVIAKYPVPDPR